MLHGPGFSHDYLEALESFLPDAGIEMYYYDQLSCNNSEHPDDAALWTIERYVEEVEEVRKGLQLNSFVLYGHSFGSALAMEYALKYPQHLRGLVVSNMAASSASFLRHTATWKLQLSAADQGKMKSLEAREAYDSQEYQHIMMEVLYPQMLCRTKPWPSGFTRALERANMTIYNQMQGRSEFLVTVNLRDWDVWARLPRDSREDTDDRCQVRRDGSRGHEEDVDPGQQRHVRILPEWKPSLHVGRPSRLFQAPARLSSHDLKCNSSENL